MESSLKRTESNEPKLAVSHHESHADEEHVTHNHHHQDAALKVLGDGSGRVYMTDEQSEIVRRKIDRRILPILMWIYFLQILDKVSRLLGWLVITGGIQVNTVMTRVSPSPPSSPASVTVQHSVFKLKQ
jgi:hypothetical protein